ncbi:hypothetical protein H4Q26_015028 [Puccinia striiformis f. sp. tritici PST-130]|nr:hypothetical protein H4Q26_015028 [Puccinia striiformis f. sp. tritici PST-130]
MEEFLSALETIHLLFYEKTAKTLEKKFSSLKLLGYISSSLIFKGLFLKRKNKNEDKTLRSDSPTSSLSDLPSSSESEREDLLVNQPIAEPKNGGVVKRDRWIPIATSSVSKNEKHKNTRKNTREMDEISCTNNDNELLNISSALPELPGFSGLEASLPPLDDELLSSQIEQRDVSAAGIHQVHASTATSGQGELPSNPPDRSRLWSRPAQLQLVLSHSDPSTGRESSMDIILEHPGLNSLVTILNNQWEMFVRARDSRDNLDDEIFSQRGRRNPRDDPEQSRPRGNDPTQSGLERPRGTSSFGRAIPASEHPDAESRFTSGTPHGRLPPVLNNNNAGMPPPPPPPPPPPSGYWMNQSMPPLQASSPSVQHYQQPVPMDLGYEHQRHYPRNGYATNQFQPHNLSDASQRESNA